MVPFEEKVAKSISTALWLDGNVKLIISPKSQKTVSGEKDNPTVETL